MQIQSDFLQNQFGAATEQFKQMTGATFSPAKNAENKDSTRFGIQSRTSLMLDVQRE
jgi:hypothetical protein